MMRVLYTLFFLLVIALSVTITDIAVTEHKRTDTFTAAAKERAETSVIVRDNAAKLDRLIADVEGRK